MKKMFFRDDDTIHPGWKIFAFIFSVLGVVSLVNWIFASYGMGPEQKWTLDNWQFVFFSFISMVFPLFLFTYLFEIYWDKINWDKFLLSFAENWLKELLLGILLGLVGTSLIFFFYGLFGLSNLSPNFDNWQNFWQILWHPIFVLLALMALFEELIFRGYIFRKLSEATNRYIAMTVLSIFFVMVHKNNDGANFLAILNIFILGLLFSMSVAFTQRLWFAWGVHFGWNYFMGVIFGFNVSGYEIKSLFENQVKGNFIFTGTEFGPESSIIATFVIIFMFFLLINLYHKKQAFSPPKKEVNSSSE